MPHRESDLKPLVPLVLLLKRHCISVISTGAVFLSELTQSVVLSEADLQGPANIQVSYFGLPDQATAEEAQRRHQCQHFP